MTEITPELRGEILWKVLTPERLMWMDLEDANDLIDAVLEAVAPALGKAYLEGLEAGRKDKTEREDDR